MRFGLSARLALIFAAVVFGTALLVTLASVLTTSDQVHDDIDRFLRQRAAEILAGQRAGPSAAGGDWEGSEDDELADVVAAADERGAVDADSEVQALDVDGEITARTGIVLPVETVDREVAAAPTGAIYRTVTIDDSEYRMITAHVGGGGALQVARDLDATNDLIGSIRARLLVFGAVLSLAGAVVGWFVARRVLGQRGAADDPQPPG